MQEDSFRESGVQEAAVEKESGAREPIVGPITLPDIGPFELEQIAQFLKNIEEINMAVVELALVGIVVDVGVAPIEPLPGTSTPLPRLEARFFARIYDSLPKKS